MEQLITESMCASRECGNSHTFSRFTSCLAEVVHGVSLEFPDDTTGSTDWRVHMSMVHVDSHHVEVLDDSYVMVPHGTYLVRENDQGHVVVYRPRYRADAEREFATLAKEYGEWLDNDGEWI